MFKWSLTVSQVGEAFVDHVDLALLPVILPGQVELLGQEAADGVGLRDDFTIVLQSGDLAKWHGCEWENIEIEVVEVRNVYRYWHDSCSCRLQEKCHHIAEWIWIPLSENVHWWADNGNQQLIVFFSVSYATQMQFFCKLVPWYCNTVFFSFLWVVFRSSLRRTSESCFQSRKFELWKFYRIVGFVIYFLTLLDFRPLFLLHPEVLKLDTGLGQDQPGHLGPPHGVEVDQLDFRSHLHHTTY